MWDELQFSLHCFFQLLQYNFLFFFFNPGYTAWKCSRWQFLLQKKVRIDGKMDSQSDYSLHDRQARGQKGSRTLCETWAESLGLRLAGLSVTTYPVCVFGELSVPLGRLVNPEQTKPQSDEWGLSCSSAVEPIPPDCVPVVKPKTRNIPNPRVGSLWNGMMFTLSVADSKRNKQTKKRNSV